MRAWPSRVGCLALAAIAALWALLLLPQQAVAWSGAGAPGWAIALTRTPFYGALRNGLAEIGLRDLYLVFGAAIGVSFVLLWLSFGPALARVGWSGRVYGGIILILAPLTVLSYLNHADGAPLRFLWGWEGWVLVLLGLWGIVAAFAPGAPRLRLWEALTLGLTLPVIILSTLASSYWPHGPVVGLSLMAIAFSLWAPRAGARAAEAADEARSAQG